MAISILRIYFAVICCLPYLFILFLFFRTYTDKDPLCVNFRPSCRHGKNTKFTCSSISMDDVIKNRKRLYEKTRKVDQDIYLTRLLGPTEPKRRGNSEPRFTTRNHTNSNQTKQRLERTVCESF